MSGCREEISNVRDCQGDASFYISCIKSRCFACASPVRAQVGAGRARGQSTTLVSRNYTGVVISFGNTCNIRKL